MGQTTSTYVSQSSSGYNSSPPADDGTQSEANRTKWSTVLTKLTNVLKTFAEAINTQLVSSFAQVLNIGDDVLNQITGSLAFGESTLALVSGSTAATRSNHVIAAETGTTDDLTNITTGSVADGCYLVIRADAGDTITVKDAATGAGEIHLFDNADYALSGDFSLTLQRRGTDWHETARSQTGFVKQIVSTQDGAVATGTTAIPNDDSIPQITEGDEYMTLAITPQDANNRLVIEVVFNFSHSGQNQETAALFQDTTANALAVTLKETVSAGAHQQMVLTHEMTAGTVVATTFRVRAGGSTGSTTTFNGQAGSRTGAGLMASTIIITEVSP